MWVQRIAHKEEDKALGQELERALDLDLIAPLIEIVQKYAIDPNEPMFDAYDLESKDGILTLRSRKTQYPETRKHGTFTVGESSSSTLVVGGSVTTNPIRDHDTTITLNSGAGGSCGTSTITGGNGGALIRFY